MVAHVLPFFPEFAFAHKTVESGRYGALRAAHFKRVISSPTWSPDLMSLEKSGGPGIDLHIHDNHFIQLLCGVPDAVFSRGIMAGGDFLKYVSTQYIYNNSEIAVSCCSGAISQPGVSFTHGFEIYLEKATMLFQFATVKGQATASPLTIINSKGKVWQPKLGSADPVDAFAAEIQYAVDALQKGTDPVALSGEGAKAALDLCWQEARSVKTGRIVRIRK